MIRSYLLLTLLLPLLVKTQVTSRGIGNNEAVDVLPPPPSDVIVGPQIDNNANRNATQQLLGFTADDAVMVFINFQNNWIHETGMAQDNQFANFWNNIHALAELGSIFEMPAFILSNSEETDGANWGAIQEYLPNAQVFINNQSQFAFDNYDFLIALEDTGRSNVIIAALTVESGLVFNSYLAKDLYSYNVFPAVDCSPYFQEGDYVTALQNLALLGIQGKTWYSISRILSYKHPEKLPQLNELWQKHLNGNSININNNPDINIPQPTPGPTYTTGPIFPEPTFTIGPVPEPTFTIGPIPGPIFTIGPVPGPTFTTGPVPIDQSVAVETSSNNGRRFL